MTTARPWAAPAAEPAAVAELSTHLGVPRLVAAFLSARGMTTTDTAAPFLEASLALMPDPALMADATKAALRLIKAIERGEKITIYGDYDVDGVTSTSVLWLFFRDVFGVEVEAYIPHRMKEGYGLNIDAIERLAAEGTQVLITVDNGSSAVAEIARATALGMEVVIMDHHLVSVPEPEAFAHLNPHRASCGYPDKHLAAVGVVFVLLVELRRQLRSVAWFKGAAPRPDQLLDLVALGTVADVARLEGINRAFVRYGVNLMKRQPRPGMEALMRVSRVDPELVVARDLGYKLGPRINAAGRLDDATRGFELLTGQDADLVRDLAQELEGQNQARRELERGMVEGAIAMAESEVWRDAPALVLYGDDWHLGVVGIGASRLVDRFQKPAILLAPVNGQIKGSARSVAGLHIKDALDVCGHLLVKHGGHRAAAGMTLEPANLEAFQAAFCQAVLDAELGPPEARAVDAEIPLTDLTFESVDQMSVLEPFGEGNRPPRFVAHHVYGRARIIKGQHLKVLFQTADGQCEGMLWNRAEDAPLFDGPVDLLYQPEIDAWRGRRRLAVRIIEVRRASVRA